MARMTRARAQMQEIADAHARLRAQDERLSALERPAGKVVSGQAYHSALRAAGATATAEIQGVGDIQTGAGSRPIDDRGPLVRQTRSRRGWKVAGDPRDGRKLQVDVVAARARLARLAEEQEQAAALERGRQLQERQARMLAGALAFEQRMSHERSAAQLRGLEADRQAWAAVVRHQEQEGARRAAADLQAAMRAHAGP